MVNFRDLEITDIIEYKSQQEKVNEYLKIIDLDYTIKNTFQVVINNIVSELNERIITDLYLDNTDTYSLVPISHARLRKKYYYESKDKNREKYKNDYENHGILLNHNLTNCLISIFSEVAGCVVERIPSIYSASAKIVYEQMEGMKISIARNIYYPQTTVEIFFADSAPRTVRLEMLHEQLASLDLGINDILPYLRIEYPIQVVLDDMSINPNIIGDYKINIGEQEG